MRWKMAKEKTKTEAFETAQRLLDDIIVLAAFPADGREK